MSDFRERLYISTTADDASSLAREFSLGVEIADYCTAYNMDTLFAQTDAQVRRTMQGIKRFTFHAAYNELCPAAIDPLARDLAVKRYTQAIDLARKYGITKIVIHTGFIPLVYYPEWFVPESVIFWRRFMRRVPEDVTICLENVMEPGPGIQRAIAQMVGDPRLRLCLDVGHAFTRTSNTPLERWIEGAAPYLSHVHIHNNDGDRDLHEPLGFGKIDMCAVIDQIESLAPDVTYTIENMSASTSVAWLRNNQYL